jgi:hypothetical protein
MTMQPFEILKEQDALLEKHGFGGNSPEENVVGLFIGRLRDELLELIYESEWNKSAKFFDLKLRSYYGPDEEEMQTRFNYLFHPGISVFRISSVSGRLQETTREFPVSQQQPLPYALEMLQVLKAQQRMTRAVANNPEAVRQHIDSLDQLLEGKGYFESFMTNELYPGTVGQSIRKYTASFLAGQEGPDYSPMMLRMKGSGASEGQPDIQFLFGVQYEPLQGFSVHRLSIRMETPGGEIVKETGMELSSASELPSPKEARELLENTQGKGRRK